MTAPIEVVMRHRKAVLAIALVGLSLVAAPTAVPIFLPTISLPTLPALLVAPFLVVGLFGSSMIAFAFHGVGARSRFRAWGIVTLLCLAAIAHLLGAF